MYYNTMHTCRQSNIRHIRHVLLTLTFDIELNLVCVAVVMLGDDGTVIKALVLWLHVLDDQTPLVEALREVDRDALVVNERVEADRQRVRVALLPPRHLQPHKHERVAKCYRYLGDLRLVMTLPIGRPPGQSW